MADTGWEINPLLHVLGDSQCAVAKLLACTTEYLGEKRCCLSEVFSNKYFMMASFFCTVEKKKGTKLKQ